MLLVGKKVSINSFLPCQKNTLTIFIAETGDVCGAMVTIVGNGHGKPNSNPGRRLYISILKNKIISSSIRQLVSK